MYILKIIEQVDMLKMQIVTRSLVKGVMSTCGRWLLVRAAYREEIVERLQDSVGREHLPKRRRKRKGNTEHLSSIHGITQETEQENPIPTVMMSEGPGQLFPVTIRDFSPGLHQSNL